MRRNLRRLPQAAVERGLSPDRLGYRWVARETLGEYFARRQAIPGRWPGAYQTVHPEAVASNPLPRNIDKRERLPADRGWWGYSFWDVPERTSSETFLATLPDCRVVWYRDSDREFYPAILNADGRALTLREIAFRPGHSRVLRAAGSPVRLEKATWILERVFHNYSHWLTAHLPKLRLLKERQALDGLILPPERSAVIDASLRMLGLEPERFATFDAERHLDVGELTVMGADRFRPELLRPVREAIGILSPSPTRRVFISRTAAQRRRLLNEEEIWPLLREAGFERVVMEELSFEQQVRLMGETAVLFSAHGAGLTNMMFCPAGAHIVEIADLSFPNPNFYALACAMQHRYWVIEGEAVGQVHPLEKDLRVPAAEVSAVLAQLDREVAS